MLFNFDLSYIHPDKLADRLNEFYNTFSSGIQLAYQIFFG